MDQRKMSGQIKQILRALGQGKRRVVRGRATFNYGDRQFELSNLGFRDLTNGSNHMKFQVTERVEDQNGGVTSVEYFDVDGMVDYIKSYMAAPVEESTFSEDISHRVAQPQSATHYNPVDRTG